MECAFNLKNVGAKQVGKEKIVTSASDLLTVPMVFVMSPLNVYVTKVFLVRTVTLQFLLMEIGANGGLGQHVTMIVVSRDEPVLVITHTHLEGVGTALKMEATHLKTEPV